MEVIKALRTIIALRLDQKCPFLPPHIHWGRQGEDVEEVEEIPQPEWVSKFPSDREKFEARRKAS